MGQLLPGQIRQVSQPVFNPNDGSWYNEVRVIQPDGSGGYVIVSDYVNRSPIQFVDYPLPTPWTVPSFDEARAQRAPIHRAAA
jgi:hypothetical protein